MIQAALALLLAEAAGVPAQIDQTVIVDYDKPVQEISSASFPDRVEVRIKLNPGENLEQGCRTDEFTIDQALINDSTPLNPTYGGNAYLISYEIPVGQAGAPLPEDWKVFSFSFRTMCKERKNLIGYVTRNERMIQYPDYRISRPLLDFADDLDKTLELDEPRWWAGHEPEVPVTFDRHGRVEVLLKKPIDGVVVGRGEGYLEPYKTRYIPVKKTQPDITIQRHIQYEVIARLIFGGKVVHTKSSTWKANYLYPFEVSNGPTIFTATRDDFSVSFRTSLPGSLNLRFVKNGSAPPLSEPTCSQREEAPAAGHDLHKFDLNLKGIQDGQYSFKLEGRSSRDDPLLNADRVYTLVKSAVPRLAGPVSLQIKGDHLEVGYTLSHAVETDLCLIGPANARLCVAAEERGPLQRRAQMNLKLGDQIAKIRNDIPEDASRTTIPLAIRTREGDTIFPVELSGMLVSEHPLIKGLKAAMDASKDKRRAQTILAQAFTQADLELPANAEPEAAAEEIVKILRKDKKGKFQSALKLALQVASSYFALPIP